ncbi:dual 3',5'-cyclic-AMP and -GMP phosphodiesterase 11A-like isoform X2 [Planococcus citri]|uniref:dual 3',5'-cyclic-AMP and -GMP phosphodiesterase 11A-like isoform X2 n=1 Tax=Planococcus citri TaxID=170843 RepID=UPI0031F7DA22
MTQLTFTEVEQWLDKHTDLCQDYFLRKAELILINKWLSAHGFATINDYLSDSRRNSNDATSSNFFNNNADDVHYSNQQIPHILVNGNANHHKRTNSKKCLRHDFARCKSRSFVKSSDSGNCMNNKESISTSRRSSLKDMRKYTSLPPNSVHMLSLLIESKVHLPKCSLRQSVNAKREMLRLQGEREFFLGIVRDISTDLDVKCLSQKVVDNLTVLLDADGASLFLVDGPKGKQTLVSKVFDVHSGASRFLLSGAGSNADNEVQLPWGVGVLGHVAETGETVNLQVACEDPRFDDEVDKITGYHTDSLLCMPVKNAYDEVIAVAQVVNKNLDNDQGYFTAKDEKLFETYLQFVGIAITNAQIMEDSRKEYERNRNLLEVVHDLFEEQTSLEKVILKIMQRAQRLLKCEKAAVLLVDENSDATNFSKLFELDSQISGKKNGRKTVDECGLTRYLAGLAERVAETGEPINMGEYTINGVENGIKSPPIKSLLAMPIRNKNYQIIGVASIINKLNSTHFDDNDEQLFEAFTIFCGLGIHNTLMYSEIEKAVARQKVSIEVLSYHTSASNKEIEKFLNFRVPCADELNLYSLSFDDFSLNEDEMLLASVTMFIELGLVSKFSIDKKALYRFLLTVKRNYRDVPYHNWRHAFNVAQVMFAILMGCEMKGTFSDLEVFGMFVGCLCHDLDHRGTNNAFQQKAGSALVLLYGSTNTMEHHHFNQAVMILSSEDLNIFSSLSAENYSSVMKVLKHSILATDLSTYFLLRPNQSSARV